VFLRPSLPTSIKFCMVVDIPDVVTYTYFGGHRLRGFWVAGGQISPSPIDFHRRPYNTLALPCESVILYHKFEPSFLPCFSPDPFHIFRVGSPHAGLPAWHKNLRFRVALMSLVRSSTIECLVPFSVCRRLILSSDQLRAASLIGRNAVT